MLITGVESSRIITRIQYPIAVRSFLSWWVYFLTYLRELRYRVIVKIRFYTVIERFRIFTKCGIRLSALYNRRSKSFFLNARIWNRISICLYIYGGDYQGQEELYSATVFRFFFALNYAPNRALTTEIC